MARPRSTTPAACLARARKYEKIAAERYALADAMDRAFGNGNDLATDARVLARSFERSAQFERESAKRAKLRAGIATRHRA